MSKSFKTILITICFCLSITNIYSQDLLQNQKFTYVPTFEGKVIFLKEIPLVSTNLDNSYTLLKDWCKTTYAAEPLISNIRYDNTNKEVVIKSKIELLLPPNAKNVREKVTMTYHLNTFIFNNKCVFELKDITYLLPNSRKSVKAEDMITDRALSLKDDGHEIRQNTQKSTLYFLNELADKIGNAVNNTAN
ncbi:DUF4468 domain-containing protein [Dysgonomonas macrotermitis]|uniref:DUF4468 domain-containing protein n=1 Tax=Dysgonomonas macrotermitis TaxID=1346286 RepID=A0A1M5D0Q9_9BACT|nr:DUF4468 domain-containing protein [Dysgonomonas macrotermitis]SHF60613.1 protein of unknown function [Dysgonomonas macrotermitis]